MIFLLFVISIAVLEAILHADKVRQGRQQEALFPSEASLAALPELLPQDLNALSLDLESLMQALQKQGAPEATTEHAKTEDATYGLTAQATAPATAPVAVGKGYNRERGRTE